MNVQDWNPVVIRKANTSVKVPALSAKDQEARRLAKIDSAEAPKAPKFLSPESCQMLVAKRLEMQKKQNELDMMCSFPTHTIRDLESRKRAPTQKELNTLNRILKIGLSLSH